MKRIFSLLLVMLVFSYAHAAKTDSLPNAGNKALVAKSNQQLSLQQLQKVSSLPTKQLELLSGRKLSFKEKVSWFILKKQLKKSIHLDGTPDKRQNDNAVLGFVLSLLGLLVFPLLAIPGYIISNNALEAEKEEPGTLTKSNKSLAKAGKTISIITGVLIILALILVLAFIAALTR